MSLTLLMLTINGSQKLARVLPALAGIADELVIGIDDSTTDNTLSVARDFTDRIFAVPHAAFRAGGQPDHVVQLKYMLPYCQGDWVLKIDHDETLSPHWHDREYVNALLSDRSATRVWIPRRWVVPPGDRYISSRHWQPDYQLRLFRNVPSLIRFNTKAHDPPVIAGEARFPADCWIEHWDYVWHDRATREQKVRFLCLVERVHRSRLLLIRKRAVRDETAFPHPCGDASRGGPGAKWRFQCGSPHSGTPGGFSGRRLGANAGIDH